MNHKEIPAPIKAPFFNSTTKILFGLMIIGVAIYIYRLLEGLQAVTNLNNQYPWGIWIAIDVASGVALAAGGFTTAAIADIFHKEEYHTITRPALLTALLGYTFVVIGLLADLGRYYNVWHPMLPSMWQGNSVLFEVGICVMMYLTVLYIEFLPIVIERFKGRVNLPGPLSIFNKLVETFFEISDKTLRRVTFLFIIAGVVLSCFHQSSLGTLMLIAPYKMNPLWYTPISPLLFLVSAIAVGFPMVIFESILSAKSFKLKPELKVLSSISLYTPIILIIYLGLKIGDLTLRNAWHYLFDFSTIQPLMFLIEMIVGVIIPIIIFSNNKWRHTVGGLFTGSVFVILGILLNRIDVFLVAYKPLYAQKPYFPSIYEIFLTVGLISAMILVYRSLVRIFPVIAVPVDESGKVITKEPEMRINY